VQLVDKAISKETQVVEVLLLDVCPDYVFRMLSRKPKSGKCILVEASLSAPCRYKKILATILLSKQPGGIQICDNYLCKVIHEM
jgi:hypothetical protein